MAEDTLTISGEEIDQITFKRKDKPEKLEQEPVPEPTPEPVPEPAPAPEVPAPAPEPEPIPEPVKKEEPTMTPEELEKKIAEAVAAALKVDADKKAEELEALKTEQTDALKALETKMAEKDAEIEKLNTPAPETEPPEAPEELTNEMVMEMLEKEDMGHIFMELHNRGEFSRTTRLN